MKNFKNIVVKLVLSLMLFVTILRSQETFEKIINLGGRSYGTCIQQLQSGDYILTGSIEAHGGIGAHDDILVAKINAFGDTLWTTSIVLPYWDGGNAIQQTSDGGFILSAYTNAGAGGMDIYLSKLDSNGNGTWNKIYHWIFYQNLFTLKQTSDGGFLLAGIRDTCGLLFKVNQNGDSVWSRSICETYLFSDLQLTTDGGYILAGQTHSGYAFLLKTDSLGETLWSKIDSENNIGSARSIKQTSDGGYIVTGYTSNCNGCSSDIPLIKFTSSGAVEWRKVFGGATTSEEAFFVGQTSNGGYIIMGKAYFQSEYVYIIKTNSQGDSLWTRAFGEHGRQTEGIAGQITLDGGIIITGQADSKLYLLKLNGDVVLDVDDHLAETPKQINLYQNYPNPFNPTTELSFVINHR